MFNLLVNIGGWQEPRGEMLSSCIFEWTDDVLVKQFCNSPNQIDFKSLTQLPALLAEETSPGTPQFARVGYISQIRSSGRNYEFTFSFDAAIPPISNDSLNDLGLELDINSAELSRTHWAVKDRDLFKAFLGHMRPTRSKPRVFSINDPEVTEQVLVSVMMPFDASFTDVYTSIKGAAEDSGLRCRRADDIWENPAIIQDVVSLIDRAKIVVCDCTGRNPNVFYEIGIAHTLGREVVMLTQSHADIPFDLRHLRYIHYLSNGEGLRDLRSKLAERLSNLA